MKPRNMSAIIGGKRYRTETATLLASGPFGMDPSARRAASSNQSWRYAWAVSSWGQTLQAYNENISPIQKIAVVNGLFVAEARNGAALIPFALDHGVWSARAEQVIGHMKRSYEGQGFSGRYDFWVTGTVSPLARKQLGHLGFTVTENVDETYGFLG